MTTICQRINESKRHGRGIHFSVEVYVPRIGGPDGQYKAEQNNRILRKIGDAITQFKKCIGELDGGVRVYHESS